MLARPDMTTRGKQLAGLLAIAILFFLPKHVECGYPGGHCGRLRHKLVCSSYEVEPLGLYLVESVAGRDVGFAYSEGESCH
jgi:hypothetical protein